MLTHLFLTFHFFINVFFTIFYARRVGVGLFPVPIGSMLQSIMLFSIPSYFQGNGPGERERQTVPRLEMCDAFFLFPFSFLFSWRDNFFLSSFTVMDFVWGLWVWDKERIMGNRDRSSNGTDCMGVLTYSFIFFPLL